MAFDLRENRPIAKKTFEKRHRSQLYRANLEVSPE